MAAPAPYRSYIQPEADAEFPAAKDRYHLYVSYACPFASRALAARNLKGLEDVIGLSVVHPIFQKTKPNDAADTHRGWTFVDPANEPMVTGLHGRVYSTEGCIPDTVNNAKFARDLYEMVDMTPRKFSVPILWDKKKQTIVSNESADILRTFNTGFRELVPESNAIDLFPPAIEAQIEEANNGIVAEIGAAYTKAAFAHTAEETESELKSVFPALARLDDLLAKSRYVVAGAGITEADVRLFYLLIRIDCLQRPVEGGSSPTLMQFTNVVGYMRELYQMPAFRKTVNWDHLRIGVMNHKDEADDAVLTGPYVDYDAPHGREAL